MYEYAIRRVLLAIPTILIVIFAAFMIIRLVPGDIVDQMLAEAPYATEEDEAALRADLGLNKPIPVQFWNYLADLARGDLGNSPFTQQSVASEIQTRLPITLEFAFWAVIISMSIALPVGILSAIRQDTVADYVARSVAILALSVPYFFTATVIIVFFPSWFGWAPSLTYKGWDDGILDHLYYYLTPSLLLAVYLAGPVMRLTRNMMLEVLRQDYTRTAWSKGLRERSVIMRHVLKNAMIPVVTLIGLQVGLAFSGSLIVETIFNMPGMGRWTVAAIFGRDYPALQGAVLVLATGVVVVNIIVDFTYAYLDPRIRYG